MSNELEEKYLKERPGCCEVLITMDANSTIETKVLGASQRSWHEIIGMMEVAKAAHLKSIFDPKKETPLKGETATVTMDQTLDSLEQSDK